MCWPLLLWRFVDAAVAPASFGPVAASGFILVINRHDGVISPDAPGDRVALGIVGVELFQESEEPALRLDIRWGNVSPFAFFAVRVYVICREIAKQKQSPLATGCTVSGVVAAKHTFF